MPNSPVEAKRESGAVAIADPRKAAEDKIQRILLDLEEDTGKTIDAVQVDTRNFGNCKTEIFYEDDL